MSFVEPKDLWYYPKYPSITQIVDASNLFAELNKFLTSNSTKLLENDTVFGTWINPKTGKVYIDINTYSEDEVAAQKNAREFSKNDGRQIVSMYNPLQARSEYIKH